MLELKKIHYQLLANQCAFLVRKSHASCLNISLPMSCVLLYHGLSANQCPYWSSAFHIEEPITQFFYMKLTNSVQNVTPLLGRHPSLDSDSKWRRIYQNNQKQTPKIMSSFCSSWRCVLQEIQPLWTAWTDIFTLLTWTAHEREQEAKANSLSLPQPDHTLDSPSANIW